MHTDRFWAAIRERLRSAGLGPPQTLDRTIAPQAAWSSPGLILGQTCGLPYVLGLRGRVGLVGTPDYGLPRCLPGWYDSAVVVRECDPRETLAAFGGGRLAINAPQSQSGCQAILCMAAPLAENGRIFGSIVTSGAHAHSVAMVADGRADLAAIDHVTWRMAKAQMPETARLRVLTFTPPTPGLPLITARSQNRAPVAEAVASAIEELNAETGNPLGIAGLWRSDPADYDIIAGQVGVSRAMLRAHTGI